MEGGEGTAVEGRGVMGGRGRSVMGWAGGEARKGLLGKGAGGRGGRGGEAPEGRWRWGRGVGARALAFGKSRGRLSCDSVQGVHPLGNEGHIRRTGRPQRPVLLSACCAPHLKIAFYLAALELRTHLRPPGHVLRCNSNGSQTPTLFGVL